MITLDILDDIYEDDFKLTEIEQKELLSLIFSNQEEAISFAMDIINYVQSTLIHTHWFHDFVVDLIRLNEINYFDEDENIVDIFSSILKVKNKEDFIYLLKKTKCFYLFKNNFYKYDYTKLEKEEISKLFNFSEDSIRCSLDTDYGLKREIFDIFGIIPSLLAVTKLDIKSPAYEVKQQIRFLIKNFKSLNIQDQIDVSIRTFFEDYFHNKYAKITTEDYKNFYRELIQENDIMFHYLIAKDKSDIELAFLNFASPIREEMNNLNNIQSF